MSPALKHAVVPGQRLGRLVVVEEVRAARAKRTVRAARCRCDCGRECVPTVANLFAKGKRKPSRSCGCGVVEATRQRSQSHGLAHRPGNGRHPLYSTWHAMIYRCESPKSPSYQWYGAKGIRVHPAWHDPAVFIDFVDSVLGPRPQGHSLDRIDPCGDYEPGNVRWADAATQTLNRRKP